MGKRNRHPKMCKTARILILALSSGYLAPTSILLAQQEGPPPDFQGPPPGVPMELESVKKQLARMTRRYGLTSSQQEAIRPLLEDERQKTSQLMEDASRPPEQIFAQAKGIHEDAAEKIASVLTETQKTKYEQDEAKRAAREERGGPGMEDGPPPPPRWRSAPSSLGGGAYFFCTAGCEEMRFSRMASPEPVSISRAAPVLSSTARTT